MSTFLKIFVTGSLTVGMVEAVLGKRDSTGPHAVYVKRERIRLDFDKMFPGTPPYTIPTNLVPTDLYESALAAAQEELSFSQWVAVARICVKQATFDGTGMRSFHNALLVASDKSEATKSERQDRLERWFTAWAFCATTDRNMRGSQFYWDTFASAVYEQSIKFQIDDELLDFDNEEGLSAAQTKLSYSQWQAVAIACTETSVLRDDALLRTAHSTWTSWLRTSDSLSEATHKKRQWLVNNWFRKWKAVSHKG